MDRIGVSFLDPLDDYELIHRIGCGTYGDVFKVSENLSPCLHRADRESLHQGAGDVTSCHQGETSSFWTSTEPDVTQQSLPSHRIRKSPSCILFTDT